MTAAGAARKAPVECRRPRPHLAEFAELLADTRRQAGLTVRQLAHAIAYSHPHVARATTGERLPSWNLTAAYLGGCGIHGEDLRTWLPLWAAAKSRDQQTRRHGAVADLTTDKEWRAAVSAVRGIVPLVSLIRQVDTLKDLSEVLQRLGARKGLDSLRKVEAETGLPRATLQGWYAGERMPQEVRLEELVVKLGASDAERREFVRCLERLASRETCDGVHPSTGQACKLSATHRGLHRAADHSQWLDDGVLTSRPVKPTAEKQWLQGPHW